MAHQQARHGLERLARAHAAQDLGQRELPFADDDRVHAWLLGEREPGLGTGALRSAEDHQDGGVAPLEAARQLQADPEGGRVRGKARHARPGSQDALDVGIHERGVLFEEAAHGALALPERVVVLILPHAPQLRTGAVEVVVQVDAARGEPFTAHEGRQAGQRVGRALASPAGALDERDQRAVLVGWHVHIMPQSPHDY